MKMGNNSEEKKRIIEMVSSGKITADEAMTLLDALGGETEPGIELKDKRGRKRNLRVDIDAPDKDGSGSAKVKVNVPLSVLKILLPLAKSGVIPEKAKSELEKQGVDLEKIIELTEKVTDELASTDEDIVNIKAGENGEGATVKVYVD